MQCPDLSPALPEPESSGSMGPRDPGMAYVCAQLPLPWATAKCPPESSTRSSSCALRRQCAPESETASARSPRTRWHPGRRRVCTAQLEARATWEPSLGRGLLPSAQCHKPWLWPEGGHAPGPPVLPGGGGGYAVSGPHSPCPFSHRDPLFPSPGAQTTQPRCSLLHTLFRERPRGRPLSRCAGRSPALLASEPPGPVGVTALGPHHAAVRGWRAASAGPTQSWRWAGAVWGWEPRTPTVYYVRSRAPQVSSLVAGVGCSLKDGGSQAIPPSGTRGARYGGAWPVVTGAAPESPRGPRQELHRPQAEGSRAAAGCPGKGP